MTVRQVLSRAFFWLLLGAILLSGSLSFYEFRRSLEDEIADNLQFGADTVLQRIDTYLFSQIENLRLWRRLEVMQDIRVDDVDKRLSQFLSDLRSGQGNLFRALYCTDRDGHIVAASDPALIGQDTGNHIDWRPVPGDNARARVEIGQAQPRAGATLPMRTRVPDAFDRGDLGFLYVMLNWDEVQQILDDAVAGQPRSALLLNGNGRIIATSRDMHDRLDALSEQLAEWNRNSQAGDGLLGTGGTQVYAEVLVGSALSGGYQHFPGLGWQMLMVEPSAHAFAPIWRMLWTLLALLLLTLVVAVLISRRIAGRIARPIAALTDFTREFRRNPGSRPPPAQAGITEVDELNRTFAEMLEALEQSREQIVRAGKLAVVGEMAAIMAHEVRTPLGILRTSAQLLEARPGLGERERELTGYITEETGRLNRLVTLLLECARPRPPEFHNHDVHEIITNVVNLLEGKTEKRGVQLETDLTASRPHMECDREQMTQVFLNLIINALDFVPDGGRIRVHTRNTDTGLCISVCDNGPGIAPELRASIFDPFFSRREGGIGLGLTIVQQIVQVHHGEIRVSDAAEGGACFDMVFDHNVRTED